MSNVISLSVGDILVTVIEKWKVWSVPLWKKAKKINNLHKTIKLLGPKQANEVSSETQVNSYCGGQ